MTLSKIISSSKLQNVQTWHMPDVESRSEVTVTQYHEGLSALGGQLPTVKDIESLQKQAYDESFQQGYQEGIDKANQEMQATVDSIKNIIKQLSAPIEQINQTVKQELVELVLAVAKQIIYREVKQSPEKIMTVINESIDKLPSLSSNIHIHVNSDDAKIIKELSSKEGEKLPFKIIDDTSITRGGCKVFSDSSSLDATVENQIAKIAVEFLDVSSPDDDSSIEEINF